MMETHFSILNLCPENRVHIRLRGSFLNQICFASSPSVNS